MTNTEYSVQVFSAIWPTRGNRTLAEVTQKNIEMVGMPKWTEEEHNLAKALQRNLKGKPEGLPKKSRRCANPGRPPHPTMPGK